jgi:hypothetical protein
MTTTHARREPLPRCAVEWFWQFYSETIAADLAFPAPVAEPGAPYL